MADMNEEAIIKTLSQPLSGATGWMKFIGVMMIIFGALEAITIVGLIVAWLPIWIGVVLFQAASSAGLAAQSGNRDQFVLAQNKLKTYFIINGVLMLITLVVPVAFLFFGVSLMSMMPFMHH